MGYSKTAYEVYIQSQLEPDDILITRRSTPGITPAWVEKNKAIEQLQNEMGMDAYRQMIEASAASARERYEFENNL